MVFDADEKRNVETFQMLKNLFEMIHIDNMKVLKALIYAKDDIQPLIDGSSKKRVRSPTMSFINAYCMQSIYCKIFLILLNLTGSS